MFVAWSSGGRSVPVLVVFAVALGAELRVSAARAIPPLAAVAVAAAVIVDRSDSAFGHAAGSSFGHAAGVLVTAGLVGATVTGASRVVKLHLVEAGPLSPSLFRPRTFQ
jgi:hypothetical protein